MIDISEKLYTTFNNTTYYDVPHKYYLNNKELISVTTLIHKYQEPFDENYWSKKKALDYGLSKQEVINCWKFINKKGTMKGSIIHDYGENLFLNKIFFYPENDIIKEFGFDPIYSEYLLTKKLVDDFHRAAKNKLIPIKTEFILYDEESLIGGMLDILFYNVTAGEYQIWDHKTNKEFSKVGFQNKKLLGFLGLLDDCDLEIYSLQLSFYKYIIEKNTGIKLGKSYVIWYSHNNIKYEVIEIKDRTFEVKKIVAERILDLK